MKILCPSMKLLHFDPNWKKMAPLDLSKNRIFCHREKFRYSGLWFSSLCVALLYRFLHSMLLLKIMKDQIFQHFLIPPLVHLFHFLFQIPCFILNFPIWSYLYRLRLGLNHQAIFQITQFLDFLPNFHFSSWVDLRSPNHTTRQMQ